MNILLVNTFHYNRGGDCVYNFKLANLLKKRGKHEIIHFAMKHPKNIHSEFSENFVPEIDFPEELRRGGITSGIKVIKRAIYSTISKQKLSALLDIYPVDIAHIQNIRGHITPSIFHVLKKKKIPIIWTQHDYFLICPNSTFYNNGKVCEACRPNRFYEVVKNKCRKNSRKASIIVMLEEYSYRILGLLKMVDFFIAPSWFLKEKLLSYGFPKNKLVHIPNFISVRENIPLQKQENYVLYFGRLSYEKGIRILIEAMASIPSERLLIAGDGPQRKELENLKDKMNANNIEFLGHVDQGQLPELIQSSSFVVVPSEWYENFPFSILESFAGAKPVVASNIGGIPELVKHGRTGLLFEPGNLNELKEKIKWMYEHPNEARQMGLNGRELTKMEYNPKKHYDALMTIYKNALKNHGKNP